MLHVVLARRPDDGRSRIVLIVPEGFRGAEPIPDDVIGIVLELSWLGVPHAATRRKAAYDLCKRFGTLGTPETFQDFQGRDVRGELVARWTREGRLLYRAVCLLQMAGLLELPSSSLPWWALLRVGRRYDSAAERREAAHELCELVNKGVRRSGAGSPVLTGDDFPLRLEPGCETLLGRLWLRVGAAANARTKIAVCRNCGKILVPTGERKRERMRSDKRTCSGRCRWQRWKKQRTGGAIEKENQSKEGHDVTSKKRT